MGVMIRISNGMNWKMTTRWEFVRLSSMNFILFKGAPIFPVQFTNSKGSSA